MHTILFIRMIINILNEKIYTKNTRNYNLRFINRILYIKKNIILRQKPIWIINTKIFSKIIYEIIIYIQI